MKTRRLGFAIAGLALLVLGALQAGCSPESFVKVKLPADVQRVTGAPAEVPLSEAAAIREEYESRVKIAAEEKAAKAAADVRAITKASKSVQVKYTAQVSELQQRMSAEVESLTEDAFIASLQADAALRKMEAEVKATTARLAAATQGAQEKADQIRSVLSAGLDGAMPVLGAMPGVGLILPALTGIVGLMIRKPGDAVKEAEAKAKAEAEKKKAEDEAYEAGRRAVRDEMMAGKVIAAINPVVQGA